MMIAFLLLNIVVLLGTLVYTVALVGQAVAEVLRVLQELRELRDE